MNIWEWAQILRESPDGITGFGAKILTLDLLNWRQDCLALHWDQCLKISSVASRWLSLDVVLNDSFACSRYHCRKGRKDSAVKTVFRIWNVVWPRSEHDYTLSSGDLQDWLRALLRRPSSGVSIGPTRVNDWLMAVRLTGWLNKWLLDWLNEWLAEWITAWVLDRMN